MEASERGKSEMTSYVDKLEEEVKRTVAENKATQATADTHLEELEVVRQKLRKSEQEIAALQADAEEEKQKSKELQVIMLCIIPRAAYPSY